MGSSQNPGPRKALQPGLKESHSSASGSSCIRYTNCMDPMDLESGRPIIRKNRGVVPSECKDNISCGF